MERWEKEFALWLDTVEPGLSRNRGQRYEAIRAAFHAGWMQRKVAEFKTAYGIPLEDARCR